MQRRWLRCTTPGHSERRLPLAGERLGKPLRRKGNKQDHFTTGADDASGGNCTIKLSAQGDFETFCEVIASRRAMPWHRQSRSGGPALQKLGSTVETPAGDAGGIALVAVAVILLFDGVAANARAWMQEVPQRMKHIDVSLTSKGGCRLICLTEQRQ